MRCMFKLAEPSEFTANAGHAYSGREYEIRAIR